MATIRFDPAILAYTSDTKGFDRNQLKPLFDRLLRGSQPIVLFVHGRGKEPRKSLLGGGFVEGKAVSKLEAYGNKTVMFSWDSERGSGLTDRDRPLSNMDEAARRFGDVLAILATSLAEVRQIPHPAVTLLAHSMGTIVVQRFIERNNGWPRTAGNPLFTNVVLSSADADNIGHTSWVDRLAAVERVFITVNPEDGTLRKSKEARQTGAVALGRDPGAALSSTATYAHIKLDAHEVFTQRPNQPAIANFFAAAFAGREIPLGEPFPPGRRFRLR